jgi:hypothetical protein
MPSNDSRRVQDRDSDSALEGNYGSNNEGEGSPKGHKRVRANTGGDSRSVKSELNGKIEFENNALVRDSDG